MTRQRLLLKLLSSRLSGRAGQRFLQGLHWTIENGEGAGLKLKLPQNVDFILGTSELPVQRALARHVRCGSVVYDIGANVGFFSLIAARLVGSTGGVCSFEPVSENATAIRRNAKLNLFEQVHVFEVALGGYAGSVELLLTDWDGGSTLSTSAVCLSEPVSRRTVRVVSLDDLVKTEKLRCPDFIKIDVEGAELDVLHGMSEVLRDSKPVLLYEIDDGERASFERRWKEIDEFVAGFEYEIRHLENSYSNEQWYVGHTLALPRNSWRTN